MDLGIRGRKAIVNGGSAGMGRGTSMALAIEGAELYISARSEERLNKSCEDIARVTGAKVTPVVADHSTPEGREAILNACPEPDILVTNCSPPPFTGDYKTIEREDWFGNLEVTLFSPVEMMKKIVPGMVERKWGRVVNIGTGAAKYPAEVRILSGPPRAALVNYSVAVAKAVAKHNVMINNVLPGMHHTASIEDRYKAAAKANGTTYEQEVQKFVEEWRIPANKFGNADNFGTFVAMFCSEQAAFVTGQSLVIDGGQTNSTF
jgi:3-oxoacyl-[acyl-carrier protein] reductase